MKNIYVFLVGLVFCFGLKAQSPDLPIKNIDGKNYFIYTVQSGDGWYSIARKFKINYSQLRLANKESDDKLSIGQPIRIPADKLKSNDPAFLKNFSDEKNQPGSKVIYHTVRNSETLFGISKLYNVTVDQLKSWNNLKGNEISKGQKLVVSQSESINQPQLTKSEVEKNAENNPSEETKVNMTHIVVPVPAEEEEIEGSHCEEPIYINRTYNQYPTNDISDSDCVEKKNPEEYESNKIPVQNEKSPETNIPGSIINEEKEKDEQKIVFGNGRKEFNEEGIATWSENEDPSTEKYFAFHQTAPIGTIIKITNINNQKSIYVKVIGKLSDVSPNSDTLIRISKASAEKLGVKDIKFGVRLLYGINIEN